MNDWQGFFDWLKIDWTGPLTVDRTIDGMSYIFDTQIPREAWGDPMVMALERGTLPRQFVMVRDEENDR